MKITFKMVAKRFLLAAVLMSISCLLITGFAYLSGEKKFSSGKKSAEKETEEEQKNGYDPKTSKYDDMSSYSICLDAACGGSDNGAENESRYEKDDNLTLAKKVQSILENEMNFKVFMTRTDDSDVSDSERVATANDNNCNAIISLARGEYINANYSQGIESYVYTGEPADALALSSYIVSKLNDTNIMLAGSTANGVPGNSNEDYYINKNSNMASVVILTGYITYDDDNEAFDNNTDTIAKAIAEGIYEYMKSGIAK